jgi:hypothetical protein
MMPSQWLGGVSAWGPRSLWQPRHYSRPPAAMAVNRLVGKESLFSVSNWHVIGLQLAV